MLKNGAIDFSGQLPIELLGGGIAEALIKVDQNGRIELQFTDVKLANALMVDALQGRLYGMGLYYSKLDPDKED